MEQVFLFWNSENPMSEFRKMRQRLQTVTGRDRTLLDPVNAGSRCPLRILGFGRQGTARFVEIFVGHRLVCR